jgi:GT2 family glycosyltransferase
MNERPAPIVLFVYNRPEHARRALASLAANRLAADSDLIVYADGARKPEHVPAVQQVKHVIHEAFGFRSIRLIEREKNLGLANSVMTGVSELCASHGRAIVIEDDLVVSPTFLEFLNAGLDRFQHDPDVLQISGYSYPAHDQSTAETFFLPMISCWGWATWSRAWAKFDPTMSALNKLDADPAARRRFNIDDAYDYYGMACQQRQGKIDSWGVRWQLSLFANDGIVLYPRDSLVFNAGADSSGTHGAGQGTFQRELGAQIFEKNRFVWPARPVTDTQAMAQVKRLLRANRPGVFRRIVQRLRA